MVCYNQAKVQTVRSALATLEASTQITLPETTHYIFCTVVCGKSLPFEGKCPSAIRLTLRNGP